LGVLSVKTGDKYNATDQRLRKAVRTTVVGTTLTVFSSSLLYSNLIAMAVWRDEVLDNPWTNPFVLGINLDSAANDLGMLIASGILVSMLSGKMLSRTLSWLSLGKIQPATESQNKSSAQVLARKSEINPSSCEED
jgi:hypothetical protein